MTNIFGAPGFTYRFTMGLLCINDDKWLRNDANDWEMGHQ
jgi:hypothetical protein